MNRQILFRGRTIGSGEWVQGDLQIQAYPLAAILLYNQEDGYGTYGNLVPVDRNTVGQFTGVLDKNGVKIFEGDIVKIIKTNEISTVIYDNNSARFILKIDDYFISEFNDYYDKYLEVIGNIHEKGK